MNLTGIISIAGKPGLYKVISQTKNGIVVESLIDGKKMPVTATQKVSALTDIHIYTKAEDMPLQEVMERIFDFTKGKETINPKESPEKLREFMQACLPEYDEDRVYNSDLKKLFPWYNLLLNSGLLVKEQTNKEEEVSEAETTEENSKEQ
jgi:hypothetical protein